MNEWYSQSADNNYKDYSNIEDMLPLYEQLLQAIIEQKVNGEFLELCNNDFQKAKLYSKIGSFYTIKCEYEKALSYYQQAIKLYESPELFNNLGQLYKSMGKYEEAFNYYQKALSYLRTKKGYFASVVLSNLGVLYRINNCHEESLSYYEMSLKALGELEPNSYCLTLLNNLGVLYAALGKYKEALNYYQKALTIGEKIWDVNHPHRVLSLNSLGALYESIGEHEEAYRLMLQASNIELNLMAQIFKLSNEQERLNYYQEIYRHFNSFISLVFQSSKNSLERIQSAFELIQRRKFIVTETTILQRSYLTSGRYPQLATLLKDYEEKTQEIISISWKNLTEEKRNYLSKIIREQQEIEQQLSRRIPDFKLQTKILEIDRHAVALELPEGSILLEFVRVKPFDFKAIPGNGDSRWKSDRYLAFILPAGQPDNVQMIDLGESENIDCLIKVFRENIILGKSDGFDRMIKKMKNQKQLDKIKDNPELNEVFQNKQQLKQLLFDPIQKCLPSDTQKLIIAPDGELNLLPFEILPLNEHQYLMDRYTISYLNVGRDLIRLKFPSTTQPTQPLIIANPDYNLNDENTVTSQDTHTQTQGSIDTVYSDLRNSQPGGIFAPIPGTALESVEISKYLGVTPKTEKNALESLIKSQTSPRILHIATHGYFLTIEHLNRLENTPFSQLDTLHRAGMQNIQNPLLRAGLAFAGANTALNGGKLPPAAEDGILTAQDVATFLDLSSTELVVLSACESGLGEVKLGESVRGLRHAFIQAGAKSLIVSLWAVSDIATAILMGQFYHYYLEDKLPVGKALEQAKRYVRNLTVGEMRKTWLTDEKIEYVGRYSPKEEDNLRILANDDNDYQPYKHPKYWAAFICLGLAD